MVEFVRSYERKRHTKLPRWIDPSTDYHSNEQINSARTQSDRLNLRGTEVYHFSYFKFISMDSSRTQPLTTPSSGIDRYIKIASSGIPCRGSTQGLGYRASATSRSRRRRASRHGPRSFVRRPCLRNRHCCRKPFTRSARNASRWGGSSSITCNGKLWKTRSTTRCGSSDSF